jgi:hypothetical protein
MFTASVIQDNGSHLIREMGDASLARIFPSNPDGLQGARLDLLSFLAWSVFSSLMGLNAGMFMEVTAVQGSSDVGSVAQRMGWAVRERVENGVHARHGASFCLFSSFFFGDTVTFAFPAGEFRVVLLGFPIRLYLLAASSLVSAKLGLGDGHRSSGCEGGSKACPISV